MAKKTTDAEGTEPVALAPDAGAGAATPVSPAAAVAAPSEPVDGQPVVSMVTEAADEASAEPTTAFGAVGGSLPAPRRRNLTWLWRTLIALAIVGLIALSAYLVVAVNDWRAYSADLENAVDDVKATAAQDRADHDAIQVRVDTVQSQLDTANARITELANEEANATDNQDALRDHMEAMIECADARQELIDVLTNSNLYFPGKSNGQVENELKTYCDDVKTDYENYLAGNG